MSSPELAEVEALLYREARLLDEHRYAEWLELYAAECRYWIPSSTDAEDPTRHVSIVFDDRGGLAERVFRLEGGHAYAQDPRSETLHVVTNIELVDAGGDADDGVEVASALSVTDWRRAAAEVHVGRCRHRLVREGGRLAIASKRIDLVARAGYLGNVSVLL